MPKLPIIVVDVQTPEGTRHYVTCLSHEQVFERGLRGEAILGVLLRPLEAGKTQIVPEFFARNSLFVEFLHSLIARLGPQLPGLIAEAKRQGEGWVYLIDQRTPEPANGVPPEDIIGVFEVKSGQIVLGSYRPSPRHLILSANGFLQLEAELQELLLEELMAK